MLSALALLTSVLMTDSPELVLITLVLFANVLIVFMSVASYIVHIKETRNQAVVGFVPSTVGLLLDLANFFSPLASILFITDLALLAVTNLLTGRLSTLAMWSWVAVAVLSLLSFSLDGVCSLGWC
jgi:hypothetical protein